MRAIEIFDKIEIVTQLVQSRKAPPLPDHEVDLGVAYRHEMRRDGDSSSSIGIDEWSSASDTHWSLSQVMQLSFSLSNDSCITGKAWLSGRRPAMCRNARKSFLHMHGWPLPALS